jgi:D-lactate dehydrogenase
VFSLLLSLQGSLSGEHGIGKEKRLFLPDEIDATTIALMALLKLTFVPLIILKSREIFP